MCRTIELFELNFKGPKVKLVLTLYPVKLISFKFILFFIIFAF